MWLSVSQSPKWQRLFLALGMQDLLDQAAVSELKRATFPEESASQPGTPTRGQVPGKLAEANSPVQDLKEPLPRRVNACRPACIGQPAAQDGTLRSCKRNVQNDVADVQETAAKRPKKPVAESADPFDMGDDSDEDTR